MLIKKTKLELSNINRKQRCQIKVWKVLKHKKWNPHISNLLLKIIQKATDIRRCNKSLAWSKFLLNLSRANYELHKVLKENTGKGIGNFRLHPSTIITNDALLFLGKNIYHKVYKNRTTEDLNAYDKETYEWNLN